MIQQLWSVFLFTRIWKKNFRKEWAGFVLGMIFSSFSLANSFLYFHGTDEKHFPTEVQQDMANRLINEIFQNVSFNKDREGVIYTLVQFIGEGFLEGDSLDKDRAQDQRTQALKVALRKQLQTALKSHSAETLLPALDLLAYDYIAYQKTRKSVVNKLTESLKFFVVPQSNKGRGDYFAQVSYRLHLAIRQSVVGNRLDTLLSEVRSSDSLVHDRLFDIVANERMTTEMRVSATQALEQNGPLSRSLYLKMFKFIKAHVEGQNQAYLDIDVNILTRLAQVLYNNSQHVSFRKEHKRLNELMNRPVVLSALTLSQKSRVCQQVFNLNHRL